MLGWFLGSESSSTTARGVRTRPHAQLRLETLEARVLMAFNGAQIQHAYGMDAVTLYDANGNPVQGDGTGETIAIVDAYREVNIASDLAHFDALYGLPDPPSFTELYAQGTPSGNTSWGLEIALDVEYAHSMAPGANILLVDAQTNSTANLYGAVDVARNYPGVSTVSMSWGSGESPGQSSTDFHFTTPAGHDGVTFFAASGDTGGTKIYPAMSPNVISVGGTSLTTGFGGDYRSESAWTGSGGGQSSYSAEPGNQSFVQSSGRRQGPDVSADANPSTGVDVYDSYGYSGVTVVGGTSAASPMWAGIVAVADQGLHLLGLPGLDGANNTLYCLYLLAYNNNYPYYDGYDFHDIQSGSAGGHQATVGYDEATGLGSPIGYNLVPDIVSSQAAAYYGDTPATWQPTVQTGTVQSTDAAGTSSGTAQSQLVLADDNADAAPTVIVVLPSTADAAIPLAASTQVVAVPRDGGLASGQMGLAVPAVSWIDAAPRVYHAAGSAQGDNADVSGGDLTSGDLS